MCVLLLRGGATAQRGHWSTDQLTCLRLIRVLSRAFACRRVFCAATCVWSSMCREPLLHCTDKPSADSAGEDDSTIAEGIALIQEHKALLDDLAQKNGDGVAASSRV